MLPDFERNQYSDFGRWFSKFATECNHSENTQLRVMLIYTYTYVCFKNNEGKKYGGTK
jgi:hypothetical protein